MVRGQTTIKKLQLKGQERARRHRRRKKISKKIFKNIIIIGMIGISKSIGIILSGLFPEVVILRNPFLYIFPQVIYKR